MGCVSHPVSGLGERTLGSLMDNLYQCTSAGAGQIAAKRAAKQDLVVGKSMALRRETVEAFGGFFSVRNVLAEDFVIGQWVTRQLGQRAVVARTPVYNVSRDKSVRTFFRRYLRWSVIHHTCVPHAALPRAIPAQSPALGAARCAAVALAPVPRDGGRSDPGQACP